MTKNDTPMKAPGKVPVALAPGEQALHAERCLDVSVAMMRRYFCDIYLTTHRIIVYRTLHVMGKALGGVLGALVGMPRKPLLLDIPLSDLKGYRVSSIPMNKNVLVLLNKEGEEVARLALYKKIDRWREWLKPHLPEL
ncbi:MAG: hypothetical protein KF690_11580 [Bacteroidetes bacterium]|nr:hypothetical protein [Bacteroidota bacterium]